MDLEAIGMDGHFPSKCRNERLGTLHSFLRRLRKNIVPEDRGQNQGHIQRRFTEKSPMKHKTIFTKPK